MPRLAAPFALLSLTLSVAPALPASYQLDMSSEIFTGTGSYGFGGASVDLTAQQRIEGDGSASLGGVNVTFDPGGTTTQQTTLVEAADLAIAGSSESYSRITWQAAGVEVDPTELWTQGNQIWTQVMKAVTSGYFKLTSERFNETEGTWAGVGYWLDVLDAATGARLDTLDRGGSDNANDWLRVADGAQIKGGMTVQCGAAARGSLANVDVFETVFDTPSPGPLRIEAYVTGMTGPASCGKNKIKYVRPEFAAQGAVALDDLPPLAPVPLPAGAGLLLAGLASLASLRRARKHEG